MNCYLCGHPILKGQKSRAEDFATPAAIQMTGRRNEHLAHANPADHLPTLYKTLEKAHAEALGVAYLKKDIRIEERKRAAQIVEKTKNEIIDNWPIVADEAKYLQRYMNAAANEIMEGE